MHVLRERIVEQAANREGVPWLVLRPCPVFGAGDSHNSYGPNRFIRQALDKKEIPLFGGGEENRNYIFIEDLVAITKLCLEQNKTSSLNLAHEKSFEFHNLAAMVANAVGNGTEVKLSERKNAITHRHHNVDRLVKWFPSFKFTNMETAIEKSAELYKQN